MIQTNNFSVPTFKGFKDCADGSFKFTSFKDDIALINEVREHAERGIKETKSIGSKITGLSTDKFSISADGDENYMIFKIDTGGDTYLISKDNSSVEHTESDQNYQGKLIDAMRNFVGWMQNNA